MRVGVSYERGTPVEVGACTRTVHGEHSCTQSLLDNLDGLGGDVGHVGEGLLEVELVPLGDDAVLVGLLAVLRVDLLLTPNTTQSATPNTKVQE